MNTNKIRIKICGITGKEDALLAAKLGAWAVGFIFVKNTPRYISPEKATEIIKNLPANLVEIGVFANESAEDIKTTVIEAGITKIQLHGDESPQFCKKLAEITGKEIIKAIKIKSIENLEIISRYKDKVSFILLDSYCEEQLGGTGKVFDWEIAKKANEQGIPVILAGGLNFDNAKQAYEFVKPYALDISSGVEKDKGIKDAEKLKTLFSVF
ncbi:MAG: phosphoribosylanthranilate isomerase [bacterium]